MKRHLFISIIIASLLLPGCGSGQKGEAHEGEEIHLHEGEEAHNHGEGAHSDEIIFSKKQAETAGLKIESVAPGEFYGVIRAGGEILSAQGDEVTIAATTNGIVSFVNKSFAEGVAVKAGQAVVTVSSKNLQDGDLAAKSRIAFETARKEYQRAEKLVKDKIISVREFEQIKMRYETAGTEYRAQAGNVTAAGVSVLSPINGYIKNRLVNQGDYVSVGQPVATVSQNRRLQLRADVPESYFKVLKSVNGANFKPSYDNNIYKLADLHGRLLSYGRSSGNSSSFIPVTFEFDNIGDFIPGAYAEIYLLAGPKREVISVPAVAITEEQGLYFVYIQLDEEGYKKQEVKLGQDNGERVEILAGLKPGDNVVVKGVYQVKLAATSSVIPEGHTHNH